MRTLELWITAALVCFSTACITPQPTCDPGTQSCPEPSRPRLTPAQAQAQLDDIDARYVAAKRDGLDADECRELIDGYQAIYERDDNVMIARFNVAALHEACGHSDAAESIYAELAAREFPPALNNLGALAWQRGEHSRALGLFERAVAADETHAIAARNNLATALRERYGDNQSDADFEQAERQLQNILAVDSSNQSAYENLARLYYDRGRIRDSSYLLLANLVIVQAQRVLAANGQTSADLHNLRGLVLMEDDDQIRALRAFREAVAVEPDHVDANRNIAMIALRFRDYAGAEQALERVLDVETVAHDPDAWIALGVAKRGLRKYDEAEQAYRQAVEVDRADPRPWYNLGILAQEHLSSTVEADEAMQIYAQARTYYETFVSTAGTSPRWRSEISEAKDRIAIIDDTIETIERGKQIQIEYERLMEAEKQARLAEIERLRQLEQQGTSVGELVGESP